MNPRCSIVVSAYRANRFLAACLRNLLDQSCITECEVILVSCDPGEDNRSIVAEYGAKFSWFQHIETARETLYRSWNRGLQKARGEFFVNANVDDALHPQSLRTLAQALSTEPNAALAYGDWAWSDEPNASFPWPSHFRRCSHLPYHPTLPLFYAYAGCHQFWRTSKLRELGGFNANYTAAGDYDALCRMTLKRWHAVYVPEVISAFYQNPHGLSRSTRRSAEEFELIQDRFRRQVSIDDLYHVDSRDAVACSQAWLDVARRALSLRVPWAEEAVPDTEYAAECVRKALDIHPTSQEAKDLLVLTDEGWCGFVRRIRGAPGSGTTRSTAGRSAAPQARTPAPVFRKTDAASI